MLMSTHGYVSYCFVGSFKAIEIVRVLSRYLVPPSLLSHCPASEVEVYLYKILLKRFAGFVAYLQSKRAPGWPRIAAEAAVLWYCHALPTATGKRRLGKGQPPHARIIHRSFCQMVERPHRGRYNCPSS